MTDDQKRATADRLRAILETEPEDAEWLWLCLFRALSAPRKTQ